MTDPKWTLDSFRRAGHGHLHGAKCVLRGDAARGAPPPALAPASAVYLAHVALECALKAQLLSRGGCATTDDLAKKLPKVHSTLFRSARGHDLGALACQLGLKGFVETFGKTWVDDECWKRMASSDRPYSLRYGAETISRSTAEDEVQRVSFLSETLLSGIKVVSLRRTGGGRK